MKNEWVDHAIDWSMTPSKLWSGARKIHRGLTLEFEDLQKPLTMQDCGFTKSKMSMLKRLYTHEESRAAAVELWKGRVERGKYGSVGFHCFNHYLKGNVGGGSYWERYNSKRKTSTGKTSRASVMGPCIQSVSITLLNKGKTQIDMFYRTTELYKKFPADLVFIRDELLAPFDFSATPVTMWRFHFANVTIHPMYFVTIIPHLDDPIAVLEQMKKEDRHLYNWAVKWTARYLCDEYHRGIAKFAQAMRVHDVARQSINEAVQQELRKYLIKNHPGHRNEYVEDGDDE